MYEGLLFPRLRQAGFGSRRRAARTCKVRQRSLGHKKAGGTVWSDLVTRQRKKAESRELQGGSGATGSLRSTVLAGVFEIFFSL